MIPSNVQSDFLHRASPKKFKYGKPGSPAAGYLTFTSATHHPEPTTNDHHDDVLVGVVFDSVKCISWNLSLGPALCSIDFAEEPSFHSFLTLLTDFGYIEPIPIAARIIWFR